MVKCSRHEHVIVNRPAVRPGAVQRVITERQDGERGFRAVGEGAGAAVPSEPRAQLTEILHKHTHTKSVQMGSTNKQSGLEQFKSTIYFKFTYHSTLRLVCMHVRHVYI